MNPFSIILTILLVAIPTLIWAFQSGKMLIVQDIIDELPRNGQYSNRSLSQIQYLVLHHSATENQDPWDYAAYHISHHGWPGIGYHFVIQPSGKIYQTNALETVSYHVENNNTPSLGICLSGNLENRAPTSAQIISLTQLLKDLKKQFPTAQIREHGDFKATACPGAMFSELIPGIVSNIT